VNEIMKPLILHTEDMHEGRFVLFFMCEKESCLRKINACYITHHHHIMHQEKGDESAAVCFAEFVVLFLRQS
jgi:hypothetical protein